MVFPDFILAMIKEHAKELPLIAGKPKKAGKATKDLPACFYSFTLHAISLPSIIRKTIRFPAYTMTF